VGAVRGGGGGRCRVDRRGDRRRGRRGRRRRRGGGRTGHAADRHEGARLHVAHAHVGQVAGGVGDEELDAHDVDGTGGLGAVGRDRRRGGRGAVVADGTG